MTNVTVNQLALLRKLDQEDELHLSIYQPDVILACRINDVSIAKGAMSITFNSVSSGSWSNVVSGMTLLVGSSLGASDLGKVRVKGSTSSVLSVAENSDVRWSNEAYLTVINLIEILPIFPRIISDPNDPEKTIWYKDYDIAYTNQNSILGSFVCMGPHRAGTLDDSGNCQFFWSASGTSHVNGDTLSYAWSFPGADGVTGSTSETPGYINYKTPGHYVQKLIVTSSGGSVDTSYRYVSIYPKEIYTTTLVDSWTLSGGQGSRNSGGYIATITIKNPLKFVPYAGAPIVVYGNHYYGGTKANIGGAENTSNILFVGYILSETIQWNYSDSSVTFQVGSVSELMKLTQGFSISVENKLNPAYWYELSLNSVKRAIYHFLRWHSTVLLVTDLQMLATDYYFQYFDTNRESLFEAVQNVLKSTIMGEIVSNRQGKLWIETSMEATHDAKTIYSSKFTLSKVDWKNEPVLQDVDYAPLSYIEIGGVVYNPYDPNSETANTALLSCAPGIAPGTHGKVESPTGLAITSQSQLNDLSGDIFAYRNSKLPTVNIELVGSYLNLDIAPLEVELLSVSAEDTVKNIAISEKYFVNNYQFDYNGTDQKINTSVGMHEVTEGVAGDTIIIPVAPPVDGFSVPVFNIPPFVYPNFSFPKLTFPSIPGVVPVVTLQNILVILVPGYGLFYASYKSGACEWFSANGNFLLADYTTFNRLDVSASGRIFVTTTGSKWYTMPFMGTSAQLLRNGFFVDNYGISAISVNPEVDGESCVVATGSDNGIGFRSVMYWQTVVSNGIISLGTPYQLLVNGQGDGPPNGVGGLGCFENKYYHVGGWGFWDDWRISRFGTPVVGLEYYTGYQGAGYDTTSYSYVHAKNTDIQYWQPQDTIRKITSLGTVSNNIIGVTTPGASQSIACDPTGQYVWIIDKDVLTNVQTIKKSADYGATWSTVTIPQGTISQACLLNLGDQYKWVISYIDVTASIPDIERQIWRTIDGGLSWIDCGGNLSTFIPSGNVAISIVKSF